MHGTTRIKFIEIVVWFEKEITLFLVYFDFKLT